MVDGERGPRCTFEVFEQMFELSPWRPPGRRRVRGRWRGVLDPVSSPAIVAPVGVADTGGAPRCRPPFRPHATTCRPLSPSSPGPQSTRATVVLAFVPTEQSYRPGSSAIGEEVQNTWLVE